MAELTKQALKVENNTSFPNNNVGAITPEVLRTFNTDIIDSTVNQAVYTADSGSWNQKINALQNDTGSYLVTGSVSGAVLTFTKDNGTTFSLAVTASAASVAWDNVTGKPSGLVSGSSQVVSILTSVNAFTSSQETKDSTLASYTGSVNTQLTNLSTSQSIDNTKWNTIGTQSGSWGGGGDVTALNAFTASQETKNSTLASYTGSVDTKFTTIGTQSGSWDNTALNAFTSSQATKNTTLGSVTASLQQQLTNIGSQSGSWVTESETGSFARTNTTNTFSETQTINADLFVSGTINAYKINTTIESSSVIFSSGSNILGDAISDTQTLNGTVIISGSQQVTGSIGINGDINMVNNSNLVTHHIKAQGSNGLELQTSNGTNIVQMGAGGGTQAAFVGAVTANSVSASSITGLGSPASFSSSVDSRLIAEEASSSLFATKFATIGSQSGSWSGGGTDLSSLNAFTQSQESKNTTLGTQSGSWQQGYQSTLALNTYTQSNDTKWNTLGAVTASQTILNNKFATTGSNTFNGNQIISGSTTTTDTITINKSGGNGLVLSNSGISSAGSIVGSNGITSLGSTATFTAKLNAANSGSQFPTFDAIISNNNNEFGGFGIYRQGSYPDTTYLGLVANAYTAQYGGTTVPMIIANGNNPDGSDSAIIWKTDGTAEHWKKSDFKYGINVTGSVAIRGNTFITGSTNISGSTSMRGNTFITGSTIISGSFSALVPTASNESQIDFIKLPTFVGANGTTYPTATFSLGDYASAGLDQTFWIEFANSTFEKYSAMYVGPSRTQFLIGTGTGFDYDVIELLDNNNNTTTAKVKADTVILQGSTQLTGSLNLSSTLTASLQQGYVWVGGSGNRTQTVPTSSFGGGGAAFPYSGTASISGSLQVTGSMSGFVNELSVTSNTASIDFTKGNFFSITLAGGATTRFEVSNTIKGQTVNIQINQPAGASTGSVVFSPTILFAGGNDYQATATGSAIDLLTLAAITGSTVLATSIKNFL